MSEKVCVISGASGGIGRAVAERLTADGYRVYDLSRHPNAEGIAGGIRCDVTDAASVKEAVARVIREAEHLDVVIANAGYGISGAAEFTEEEDALRQFDVNFFGAYRLIREAMPHLRARGGKVLAVSSAAAVFAIPFQSFYSASKSALATWIAALANEVGDHGVSAGFVLLGDVKTGFTAARKKTHAGREVYGDTIDRSVARMEKDETEGMSPESINPFTAARAGRSQKSP